MIKVFYTSLSKINHDAIVKKYLLEYDMFFNDWDKINEYIKWEDKQLTILGRLLLFKGIKYLGYETNDLKIKYTVFGKPFFLNNALHFNISHSENIVVCAISNEKLGIDIEKIKNIEIDSFKKIFSDTDFNKITTAKNKLLSFYNHWTRLESLIKTIGHDLNKKEIIIHQNNAYFENRLYYYTKIKIKKSYICTLCTIKKSNHSLEIIPFQSF